MLSWFLFLLLWRSTIATENAMEKFQGCGKPHCLLIQCYLPISSLSISIVAHSPECWILDEFIQAAEIALSPFEDFIQRQHVFISYVCSFGLSGDHQPFIFGLCLASLYGSFSREDRGSRCLSVRRSLPILPVGVGSESLHNRYIDLGMMQMQHCISEFWSNRRKFRTKPLQSSRI